MVSTVKGKHWIPKVANYFHLEQSHIISCDNNIFKVSDLSRMHKIIIVNMHVHNGGYTYHVDETKDTRWTQ